MNYDLDTEEGMENSKTWLNQLLSTLTNNGTWYVPRSDTVVRVNKTEKTASIQSTEPDPSLARVFVAIGYAVEEV